MPLPLLPCLASYTLLLLPHLLGCPPPTDGAPPPPARAVAFQGYTVQDGDSLGAIAKHFGVSVAALAEANWLTTEGDVLPGRVLRVPRSAPRPAALARAPGGYIVRSGDTVDSVAAANGVSSRRLRLTNGLLARQALTTGRSLVIPAPLGGAGKPKATRAHAVVLRAGMRYLGVPYRYGGSTSSGIDCSGLVMRTYESLGIALPHRARLLFSKGVPVARRDLLPGDLVFFSSGRQRGVATHVGLYLGDGRFLHASSRAHRVTVDSLSAGRYAKSFIGARRVLPIVPAR